MAVTRSLAGLAAVMVLVAGCSFTGEEASSVATTPTGGVVVTLPPCPDQPADAAKEPAPLPLALACVGNGSLDLRRAPGVPTVINVWASWCAPCRDELPAFGDFARQVDPEQLRVIGVVTSDVEDYAVEFAQDSAADFPAALDQEGQLLRDLGVVGPPVTLFIRADGSLSYVERGPVDNEVDLRDLVREHLGV